MIMHILSSIDLAWKAMRLDHEKEFKEGEIL
jgi:hypothetical protein